MDMQDPDYETEGMAPTSDAIGLEGALKSTDNGLRHRNQWPPAGTVFENPDPTVQPENFSTISSRKLTCNSVCNSKRRRVVIPIRS